MPARKAAATGELLGSRGLARLVFRSHAVRRMFERRMTVEDVRAVIETGETIERNPADLPYPSRLMLGRVSGRLLHVVVADSRDDGTIVVTVLRARSGAVAAGLSKEARAMKCVVCRSGETRPGTATLVLERGDLTLVLKNVPAEVCENCGEEYLDETAATSALASAERAAADGVTVEIREFRAA